MIASTRSPAKWRKEAGPDVGIVVPTLGQRPEWLRGCLSSLEAQEGIRKLIIVVTPEHRIAVVNSVCSTYPKVEVIPEQGCGLARAIQTGWSEMPVSVRQVAWLGDDDVLVAESLRRASAALNRGARTVMVYGRVRYMDLSGRPYREVRPGQIAVPMLKLGRNLIAQPGCLYRREAIEQVGGLDLRLNLAFDVDLHVKLAGAGRVRYVPELLAMFRVHPGSLTTAEDERSRVECQLIFAQRMSRMRRRLMRLLGRPIEYVFRLVARVCTRVIG